MYELTDISLNDLYDIFDEISDSHASKVSSILLDAPKKQINVRLLPNSLDNPEIIAELSSKYGTRVSFEYRPCSTPFVNIIGGNPLNTSSGSSWGTIGFSCTYTMNGSSHTGILTAGHVAYEQTSLCLGPSASNRIYFNTSNAVIQYSNNDFGDYAIIPADVHTPTNLAQTANGTFTMDSYHSDVWSDSLWYTYVNKYGNSTGTTNGKLLGPTTFLQDHPYNENEKVLLLGMWEVYNSALNGTNRISDSGDSGAPVWQTKSDGTDVFMGILSGGYHTPEDPTINGKYFYFTPIYIIEDNLPPSISNFELYIS